jgi:hypothetical protein
MKKTIGLILLVFSMALFAWAENSAGGRNAGTPKTGQALVQSSPSPTPVPAEFSRKQTPIPYYQESTVFKKKSNSQTVANLGLESYYLPEGSIGREKFYNDLNAGLFPSLSNRPKALTPEERFWGTVSTIAGYGMAAGAAAQALGIIPDGKPKDEKKKK